MNHVRPSHGAQARARSAGEVPPAMLMAKGFASAASDAGPIKVMLVDDHPVVRLGIAMCLKKAPQVQVVAQAGDSQAALADAATASPDVVLMDIDMPDGDGLTLTRRLHKELPHLRVLIFSSSHPAEFVMRVLQSGARGFITKNSPVEELVRAIEKVHRGETYFSADVAQGALSQLVCRVNDDASDDLLSPREREVLTQIAEGLSSKQIASELGVGLRTIDTHRDRIMQKLDIHSIAGLTRFAIAKGYVSLGSRRDVPPG